MSCQNSGFEALWQVYPRRVGKGAARKAYEKALKKIDHEKLIERVTAYAASVAGKELRFVPHLATWLNQERWDDELEAQTEIVAKAPSVTVDKREVAQWYADRGLHVPLKLRH